MGNKIRNSVAAVLLGAVVLLDSVGQIASMILDLVTAGAMYAVLTLRRDKK